MKLEAFSQRSYSINIQILKKMAQEKINVSNKSTALLKFLGIQYQSAFQRHQRSNHCRICEECTAKNTANTLCTPQSIFRVRFSFTSKQLIVEIPYLEELISSVIRHFNLLPYRLVLQFRIVTEGDAW